MELIPGRNLWILWIPLTREVGNHTHNGDCIPFSLTADARSTSIPPVDPWALARLSVTVGAQQNHQCFSQKRYQNQSYCQGQTSHMQQYFVAFFKQSCRYPALTQSTGHIQFPASSEPQECSTKAGTGHIPSYCHVNYQQPASNTACKGLFRFHHLPLFVFQLHICLHAAIGRPGCLLYPFLFSKLSQPS